MPDTYSHYSQTVEYYSRYRPRYPETLIEWLTAECGLTPGHVIADIGSGTGQMTEHFLQHGHPVYAVEPNPDMRHVAEEELAAYPRLTSMGATAEATTLPDHAVDLITVGNAFHWFDHARTREAFLRILKPGPAGSSWRGTWNGPVPRLVQRLKRSGRDTLTRTSGLRVRVRVNCLVTLPSFSVSAGLSSTAWTIIVKETHHAEPYHHPPKRNPHP